MPYAPKTRRPPIGKPRGRQQHSKQVRGYGSDWERFRDSLFSRLIAESNDPWCRLCRSNAAGTARGGALLDHLIPPGRITRPGTTAYMRLHRDPHNLVPVCEACNNAKGNRLPRELRVPLRDNVLRAIEQAAARAVESGDRTFIEACVRGGVNVACE